MITIMIIIILMIIVLRPSWPPPWRSARAAASYDLYGVVSYYVRVYYSILGYSCYMHIYIYIYIYIHNNDTHINDVIHDNTRRAAVGSRGLAPVSAEGLPACGPQGNHLSSSTCRTRVFFKSDKDCGKFDQPHQTSNAVENKRGRIRQVALDKSSVGQVVPPKVLMYVGPGITQAQRKGKCS